MNLLRQSVYEVNVGNTERWVSLFTGGALVFSGLTQRGVRGVGKTLLGLGFLARGATGHCQLYGALGINTANAEERAPWKRALKIEKTLTVNAPVEELYRFWRNFENLPCFMRHLESVQILDERHSHWVTRGPAGMKIEWDAAIINELENEHISWQSLPHADVYNSGSVHFHPAPGGQGTQVKVVLRYTPPAGALGVAFTKLFQGDPAQQVEEDLHRFKSLIETGEILTADGQPLGSGSRRGNSNTSEVSEAVP